MDKTELSRDEGQGMKSGGRKEYAVESKRDVFSSLTGLKGIFILGIVLFHSNTVFNAPFQDYMFFAYQYGGGIGNIMFFMLSGFLMSYCYKEKIWNQDIKFIPYIKKRLIKLYPIYFVTNLIQLLLIIYTDGINSVNWKLTLLFASMMSSGWIWSYSPYNYPCWFVSVLILCYIIYYVICTVAKRRKIYRCSIVLFVLWGYFLETKDWNIPFCYLADGQAFFNFFIGCGLYELYIYIVDSCKKKAITLGVFAALGIGIFSSLEYEMPAGSEGLLFSIFFCPVMILCTLELQWLNSFFSAKVLQWFGKISKWIYFWHIPILTILIILMDSKLLMNFNNIGGYICYLLILCSGSSILYDVNLKAGSHAAQKKAIRQDRNK